MSVVAPGMTTKKHIALMKRGFLFGLGSFLALAAVAGAIGVFTHRALIGIIILFIAGPLSALSFRRAIIAPIGPRSRTVI